MSSRFLVFLFALCALPASSFAFCGLQSCPRVEPRAETAPFDAGLRLRGVAFDIAGNEGIYLVTAPRFFARAKGFALGTEIPLTRLENGGEVSFGLSNPLVMAQYARRLSHAWSGETGLQVELPFGDQEHGLAGDHVMLLPWIGLRRDWDAWYVSGMLGYSHALEAHAHDADGGASARISGAGLAKSMHEGHEHGGVESPVLVNPHADREAQARAAVGWIKGRGTTEAYAFGQVDVTENGPTTYVRAGASYAWALGRFTALNVSVDAPVTAARRNVLEIGAGVKTGW